MSGRLTGCWSASAAVSRFEESGFRRSRMKFFANEIGGKVTTSCVTNDLNIPCEETFFQ